MKAPKKKLAKLFEKLGMRLFQDSKNPRLFLIYRPGKASHEPSPAKYLLYAPKKNSLRLYELLSLSNLSAKLKKDLIILVKNSPPFDFLHFKKINF